MTTSVLAHQGSLFFLRSVFGLLAACTFALCACEADAPDDDVADVGQDVRDAETDRDAPADAPADLDVDDPGDVPDLPQGPPTVLTDYSQGGGFWSTPFPDESRRNADGRPDLTGFPNPLGLAFVDGLVGLIARDVDGFGLTSAVYFPASEPLDPESLPDLRGSLEPGAAMFLVGVDPGSPDHGVRIPVTSFFEVDAGPYGTSNLLSVLPLQGRPLRPGTRYAAVVTTGVLTADGEPLTPASQLDALKSGVAPPGMGGEAWEDHRAAYVELGELGLAEGVVAMAVFRTGHPTAQLVAAREAIVSQPRPEPEAAWVADEVYDEFCVFSTTVQMPIYQQGDPPFTYAGGDWVLGPDGRPVLQGSERARVVVTLPRVPAPDSGFPTAVFVRTGGGGDRPLVDRGVHAQPHGANIEEGAGPALHLARAGYAGVSVDGPHGGLRNITGTDEQFLIFNFQNPVAMRDNIRQSALELMLVAHLVEEISIPAASCPGVGGTASLDDEQLVLMGHSMGATIGPLTLALEPKYTAGVFSGAGGSWIANVVHKLSPLEVRPLAELLIGYRNRDLHEHDPVLTLLQWGGESADPPVYARQTTAEPAVGQSPRHILMVQGVADTYILPPMANALSLSWGLDLAGPALDEGHPVAGQFTSLSDLLDLVGRGQLDFPVAGNLIVEGHDAATAVVVQHLEDGIEDGHEVFFQLDPPKRQYRCFLESYRAGTPSVPAGIEGPCQLD
jgi:hypothetical protein